MRVSCTHSDRHFGEVVDQRLQWVVGRLESAVTEPRYASSSLALANSVDPRKSTTGFETSATSRVIVRRSRE